MNLPWVKAVTALLNTYNLSCTHQLFCHPACPRRQARAARRLMLALRSLYGEKTEFIEEMFVRQEEVGPGDTGR